MAISLPFFFFSLPKEANSQRGKLSRAGKLINYTNSRAFMEYILCLIWCWNAAHLDGIAAASLTSPWEMSAYPRSISSNAMQCNARHLNSYLAGWIRVIEAVVCT